MEKQYDVTALGELLIDFTDSGVSGQGNALFEANPGGAPCNVLAMLNKLGYKTAFIGKVGNDIFGNHLKGVLEGLKVDISGLVMDEECRTTLAFVKNQPDGDRDFSFYRNPGADMMLRAEEVREATKHALAIAKEGGCLISFDPNIREPLWDSLETAREQVRYGLRYCDVLKISDNEIQWLTGKEDYTEGVLMLQEEFHIPLILLSMGKEGSRAYYQKNGRDMIVEAEAFLQEATIETTGAGDTFMGSCLHFILENGLEELSVEKLGKMLTFANAAASIITTRKGALRVMPERKEIEQLLLR